MKLVLFDLDGTLMVTRGVGKDAFVEAGQEVFGPLFSLEGVELGGGLDPQLIQQCCETAGLQSTQESRRSFRASYVSRLQRALDEESRLPQPRHHVLPNVIPTLELVQNAPDTVLGLLTGNFEEAADIKLASVGLSHFQFQIRVFGDAAPSRGDMVALAMEQCSQMNGISISPSCVLIVGDTPRDVACAHTQNALCLAVATGRYSRQELKQGGADWVVDTLEDHGPLLQWLQSVG